jgi:hypothetical protein
VVALVAGPMLFTGWRKRRQSSLARQIALADALRGQMGPVVTPRMKRRLWGPWEIQIAGPLFASTAAGMVLAIVNQVRYGVEDMGEGSYRVVLCFKPIAQR